MFSTFITVALFVSLAIQRASAGFAINTPKLLQCDPVQISWAPAVSPYTIEVVPADDPCGDALDTIEGLTSTILDYAGKLASGTQVVLFISDAAGNEAWSGPITIGASSNSTCINANAVSSPSTVDVPAISPTTTGPSPSSSVTLGGAINNAGSIPSSGALSVRQASAPLLSITALAATLALTM